MVVQTSPGKTVITNIHRQHCHYCYLSFLQNKLNSLLTLYVKILPSTEKLLHFNYDRLFCLSAVKRLERRFSLLNVLYLTPQYWSQPLLTAPVTSHSHPPLLPRRPSHWDKSGLVSAGNFPDKIFHETKHSTLSRRFLQIAFITLNFQKFWIFQTTSHFVVLQPEAVKLLYDCGFLYHWD